MQSARIIGGAGTGKTTELMRLMEATLTSTVKDPMRMGFISFTRAARREAASRAADRFGIPVDDLERNGWFRTIHSVCHRMLGIGDELLTDRKESRQWIAEAVGEDTTVGVKNLDGDVSDAFEIATEAGKCLAIWDVARSRMVPVDSIVEWSQVVDPIGTPDIDDVRRIIAAYERAKSKDGRYDFTDLLLRVAGKRHMIDFLASVEPEGDFPHLPVWFFDEQQDTSALSNLVCLRLIIGAKWVYVVGDPFQAIYGFAGADAKCFMNWPIAEGKQRILGKSFRCPARVLAAGESILKPCTDYFDRGIEPVSDGGSVESESFLSGWEERINPTDSWLILARTNRLAFRLSELLDESGIPWGPTQSSGNKSHRKAAAVGSLYSLSKGSQITGSGWYSILKVIPSKFAGVPLLETGTKKRLNSEEDCVKLESINIDSLQELGATPMLRDAIKFDHWKDFLPKCEGIIKACDRWGADALINPQVRIGTIHSAKGAEAENVAVLTSITQPIRNAMNDDRGFDEERRVWYVAATRSKQQLLWLNDYRDKMRFNYEE